MGCDGGGRAAALLGISRVVLLGGGLHHVISFPAVFVVESAAEPTIFELKSTTADGRAVSADSFRAWRCEPSLREREQERPRLSATKLKRPRAKWPRPRRRSGSLLRRRTRNRPTRVTPPASRFPTDRPSACWDCWLQGRS